MDSSAQAGLAAPPPVPVLTQASISALNAQSAQGVYVTDSSAGFPVERRITRALFDAANPVERDIFIGLVNAATANVAGEAMAERRMRLGVPATAAFTGIEQLRVIGRGIGLGCTGLNSPRCRPHRDPGRGAS